MHRQWYLLCNLLSTPFMKGVYCKRKLSSCVSIDLKQSSLSVKHCIFLIKQIISTPWLNAIGDISWYFDWANILRIFPNFNLQNLPNYVSCWPIERKVNLSLSIMRIIQNLPGPLLPPDKSRPSRKMTALSYSCTTWNDNKNVTKTSDVLGFIKLCSILIHKSRHNS